MLSVVHDTTIKLHDVNFTPPKVMTVGSIDQCHDRAGVTIDENDDNDLYLALLF